MSMTAAAAAAVVIEADLLVTIARAVKWIEASGSEAEAGGGDGIERVEYGELKLWRESGDAVDV